MKLVLVSCEAQRPDRRAISKCITEISYNLDPYSATDITEILLEGDTVTIELDNKNTASALRTLRKLHIDYEVID